MGAGFAAAKAVYGVASIKGLKQLGQLTADEFSKLNQGEVIDKIGKRAVCNFNHLKEMTEGLGKEFNYELLISSAKASAQATKKALPAFCIAAGALGIFAGVVTGNILKHVKGKQEKN